MPQQETQEERIESCWMWARDSGDSGVERDREREKEREMQEE